MGRIFVGSKHVGDRDKSGKITPKKNLTANQSQILQKEISGNIERNISQGSSSTKPTTDTNSKVYATPEAATVLKENYPNEAKKVTVSYGKYKTSQELTTQQYKNYQRYEDKSKFYEKERMVQPQTQTIQPTNVYSSGNVNYGIKKKSSGYYEKTKQQIKAKQEKLKRERGYAETYDAARMMQPKFKTTEKPRGKAVPTYAVNPTTRTLEPTIGYKSTNTSKLRPWERDKVIYKGKEGKPVLNPFSSRRMVVKDKQGNYVKVTGGAPLGVVLLGGPRNPSRAVDVSKTTKFTQIGSNKYVEFVRAPFSAAKTVKPAQLLTMDTGLLKITTPERAYASSPVTVTRGKNFVSVTREGVTTTQLNKGAKTTVIKNTAKSDLQYKTTIFSSKTGLPQKTIKEIGLKNTNRFSLVSENLGRTVSKSKDYIITDNKLTESARRVSSQSKVIQTKTPFTKTTISQDTISTVQKTRIATASAKVTRNKDTFFALNKDQVVTSTGQIQNYIKSDQPILKFGKSKPPKDSNILVGEKTLKTGSGSIVAQRREFTREPRLFSSISTKQGQISYIRINKQSRVIKGKKGQFSLTSSKQTNTINVGERFSLSKKNRFKPINENFLQATGRTNKNIDMFGASFGGNKLISGQRPIVSTNNEKKNVFYNSNFEGSNFQNRQDSFNFVGNKPFTSSASKFIVKTDTITSPIITTQTITTPTTTNPSYNFNPSINFPNKPTGGKPPKPPVGGFFFDWPSASYTPGTGVSKKTRKQPKGYTPSAYAAGFNIKGKASKIGIKSGLGLRPIKIK